MKKKISVWCLFLVMSLFLGAKENAMNIQAANLESKELSTENKVKSVSRGMFYRDFEINTTAKAEKIVISVPGYVQDNIVRVKLCNREGDYISASTLITSSSQKVTYYLKGASKYYVEALLNDTDIKVKIKRTTETASSGKSFNAATTINAGNAKGDVMGYNTSTSTKQYYKIKVDKEKLVRLNFKKSESSGSLDQMDIRVYKSTNTKEIVARGSLYEGQKSAYILIRNSNNYKTKKGTYYIVIQKKYLNSGFQYSISY